MSITRLQHDEKRDNLRLCAFQYKYTHHPDEVALPKMESDTKGIRGEWVLGDS